MEDERKLRRLLSFEGGQTLARLSKALYSGSTRPTKSPGDGEPTTTRSNRVLRYEAPAEINCLAAATDRHVAAIAGKDFLHVVDMNSPNSSERTNSTGSVPSDDVPLGQSLFRLRLDKQVQPTSLEWGSHQTSAIVAMGTASGSINLYSAGATGIRRTGGQTQDLARAINSLSFGSAVGGNLILGAASDGSVRLWDLRQGLKRVVSTFPRVSDIAREVEFRPESEHKFATIYDSGVIQRWDLRQPQVADLRLNAHMQGLTLNWHPTQNYLLSGGRDKLVQVWNMSTDARTPEYTFSTASAVARARWMPGDTSVATSAVVTSGRLGYSSFSVSYWSLQRYSMPTFSVEAHKDVVSDIVAISPTLLWSAGRDGMLIQHDLRHEPSVWDSVPVTPFDWSVLNESMFNFQNNSIPNMNCPDISGPVNPPSSVSPMAHFDKTSFPFTAEDTVNRNFNRLSLEPQPTPLLSFELPANHTEKWVYQAENYLFDAPKGSTLAMACFHNAQVALKTRDMRTSQVWNIIAVTTDNIETEFIRSLSPDDRQFACDWLRGLVDVTYIEEAVDDGPDTSSLSLFRNNSKETRASGTQLPDMYGWSGKPNSSTYGMSGVSFASDVSGEESEDVVSLSVPQSTEIQKDHGATPRVSMTSSSGRSTVNRLDSTDSHQRSSFVARRRASRLAWDSSVPGKGGQRIAKNYFEFVENATRKWDPLILVRDSLQYALDEGALLTATSMLLLFRKFTGVTSQDQHDEIIISCIQQLQATKCFVPAAHIMSITTAWRDRVGALDTTVDTLCHRCLRPLSDNAAFMTNNDSNVGFWYCSHCKNMLDGCSLCNEPVKGLGVIILYCGHRTHERCWNEWVVDLDMNECPAGCGQSV